MAEAAAVVDVVVLDAPDEDEVEVRELTELLVERVLVELVEEDDAAEDDAVESLEELVIDEIVVEVAEWEVEELAVEEPPAEVDAPEDTLEVVLVVDDRAIVEDKAEVVVVEAEVDEAVDNVEDVEIVGMDDATDDVVDVGVADDAVEGSIDVEEVTDEAETVKDVAIDELDLLVEGAVMVEDVVGGAGATQVVVLEPEMYVQPTDESCPVEVSISLAAGKDELNQPAALVTAQQVLTSSVVESTKERILCHQWLVIEDLYRP